MHGFICAISLEEDILPIDFEWKVPFDFQGKMIKREIRGKNYQIEQYTSEKFIEEKLWIDNDTFLFIVEGLIVNIDQLKIDFSAKNATELIQKLYNTEKQFFKHFEGNFSGLFYHKKDKIWYTFNNQSGTKRIFYFCNSNLIVVGNDLFTLVKALKTLNESISLNEQAAYLLLTSSIVFENMTLVNEVKKLQAGEYLEVSDNRVHTDYYFNLANISEDNSTKKSMIENLNFRFNEAIILQHEIDLKYDFNHLTTLSGGLDSRMELFSAKEMGYSQQIAFNFSKKGYADQLISKQIAEKYDIPLLQFSLSPDMMLPVDDIIAVNDGLISYTNCCHVFSILNQLKDQRFGAIHTGIMGDTVMGSSVNDDARIKKRLYSVNTVFPDQINYIDNLISTYKNAELCLIYNLIFFGESNGFVNFDLMGETLSPFLNTSFLSYAYSIPNELKFNRKLYIEWIKTCRPGVAGFVWETIAGKPTNNQFLRQFYRYKRAVIKRLPIETRWKDNMSPEKTWYDQNQFVREKLDQYFFNNVSRISNSKLSEDVIALYNNEDFNVKARCITLVGAIKLLFD